MKRLLRLLLVVYLVLPFILLRNDTTRGALVAAMDALREAGPVGILLFLAMEVVAGMMAMPIWLMACVAGYIYGFPQGGLVAVPGVTLAACGGYALGRAVFSRGFAAGFTESHAWRAIQRATASKGLKIVMLLRVTPVMPQNLLHALFATTSVRLRDVVLGTLVGLAPVTFFQVYLGSLVKTAAELLANKTPLAGPMRWAAPAAVVVASLVGLFFLVRFARRTLNEALESAPEATLPGRPGGDGQERS